MLCKKYGMNERKCKSHSSENCFGKRSDHEYIKEGMGGRIGNRATAAKQYQKYKNK